MLTVIKRQRLADPARPDAEALPVQRMKIGKLFLVDLAGSERLKKSRSTGEKSFLQSFSAMSEITRLVCSACQDVSSSLATCHFNHFLALLMLLSAAPALQKGKISLSQGTSLHGTPKLELHLVAIQRPCQGKLQLHLPHRGLAERITISSWCRALTHRWPLYRAEFMQSRMVSLQAPICLLYVTNAG